MWVELVIGYIRAVVALAIIFCSCIPYVFVLICWMLVSSLLPETWFHIVDNRLWDSYQRMVVFFFEHCTGVQVYIDGVIPSVKENVLFLGNHQCLIDWIIADFLAVRQNAAGYMRYVFKNSIKYYPLYGFAFGVHGGVFVRRDGKYNIENMRKILQKLIRRKTGLYFLIYPEGTRFSPNPSRKAILDKSQNFAINMGLKPLQQVLTPRVKAFECALETLQDYVDAVYDVTVVYSGFRGKEEGVRHDAPHAIRFLTGSCKKVHIHFTRIPIGDVTRAIASREKDVTTSTSAAMLWLHERFALKDDIIESIFAEQKRGAISGGEKPDHSEKSSPPVSSSWKRSVLPLSSTLPSFLLYMFIHYIFLSSPIGRMVYGGMAIIGTVSCMLYSHFIF